MKIINKKIVLLFSVILLLSIAAFSTITLLFADEENGIEENSVKVAQADYQEGMSIIDYIIENSYNTDDSNDQTYHVVEIYSGSSPSALQTMVEDASKKVFEQHVLNDHKSSVQTKDLNPGKIDYTGYNLHESDATLIAAIQGADLLYISEDPSSPWVHLTNDITANVRQAINTYALTNHKPIIFDSHNQTMQNIVGGDKTVQDVAETYWCVEGPVSYATFMWPHDMAMNVFMDPAEQSATFVALNGENQKANVWIPANKTITVPDPHTATNATRTETEYIGKILFVHNSADAANDSYLEPKIRASFTSGAYDFTDVTIDASYGFDTSKETLILDQDSDLYKYGYFGRLIRPTAIQFDSLDMADPDQFKELAHVDYGKYDFVIVEPSTKDVVVGTTIGTADDVYAGLIQAMSSGTSNGGCRVLFDSTIAPNPGGSGNNSTSELTADNIKNIYTQLASPTDSPLEQFVLITTREKMSVYATATNGVRVKEIANIINAGSFRGITGSGSGDSSNTYTVLEIEPCYPINTALATYLNPVKTMKYHPLTSPAGTEIEFQRAAQLHNLYDKQQKDSYYYIRTDGVLNNVTSDEIDFGTTQSLTTLLENPTTLTTAFLSSHIANVTDYYNWRISKAKIAHATGRDINKLQVIHMSSTEFACSRKSLLDNYDAIYIGGDNSAIKEIDRWYAKQKNCYCYNMYFHNGDIYTYTNDLNDKINGCDYGVFSGNDLTVDKRDELIDYVTRGMPVIIDKDVCDAFKGADNASTAHTQTLLDPESNMFKFLDAVTDYSGSDLVNSSIATNTVLNFESGNVYKADNNDQHLGNTKEGFATVFLGKTDPTDAYVSGTTGNATANGETELTEALKMARPLLAITQCPTTYDYMDESTWIDPNSIGADGLKWKVSVSTPAKVNLWIDDDSNGKFDEDKGELVASTPANQANVAVPINFPIDSDYYGVVYWKIEVKATNGLSSSKIGCCKIKRDGQTKMYVNLLEIMPPCVDEKASDKRYRTNASSEVSLRTMFLCPDCQFAKSKLRANRYSPTGMYRDKIVGGDNTFYNGDAPNLTAVSNDVKEALKGLANDASYAYNGTNLGTHTHDFGIVKYDPDKYLGDSNATSDPNHLGADDIGSNWFDVIRNDYDVDMTVMYTDEFDARISEVNSYYSTKNATQKADSIRENGQLSDKYYNYLLAMRAVINGYVEGGAHDTYHTNPGPNCTVNFDEIDEDFKPITGDEFTTAMRNVGISRDMLTAYARASYQMDDDLTTHYDSFSPDWDTKASGKFKWVVDDITTEAENSGVPRDMRKYYDIFNTTNDTGNGKIYAPYFTHYCNWRDGNIFKNLFFELYQKYLWYASYDVDTNRVDLDNIYTCVAIGAAEHFGVKSYQGYDSTSDLSEASCDALLDYIRKEGNLILFHDSLNSDANATKVMTQKLSSAFGQNARHQDEPSKWNTERYYISDLGNSSIKISPRMLSLKGKYIHYGVGQFEESGEQNLMYRYSLFSSQCEEEGLNNTRIGTKHMKNMISSGNNTECYPTDKAEKNNEGIITLYPFGIPDKLQIGATSPQGYAVDVEDDNVVVYYSLVGGTQGTSSSLFAADPMDGINNYFLYQNGSITYTGAGHGLLTGFGRENNDERKLFINCIVNAGKKSARGASLNLYDLDTTKDLIATGKGNKTVIPYSGEDANYYMEIEDLSDFEGFDFLASVPTTGKLKHVKIFYDVDHTQNLATNGTYSYSDSTDKLILDADSVVVKDSSDNVIINESIDGNLLKPVKNGISHMLYRPDLVTPMIALKDDCFDNGTNNQYAYIVVEITTESGTRVQEKSAVLRLQYKPTLSDLN